jgi:methyl-accepting chemotaxis protein
MTPDESSRAARLGLRGKLLIAFAAQTLLIGLVIIAIEQVSLQRSITRQAGELGSAIADTVDSTVGFYILNGLRDDLQSITTDLRRSASVEYADFVTPQGKPLTGAGRAVPAVVHAAPLGGSRDTVVTTSEGERLHLFIRAITAPGGDRQPIGYFRLLMNEREAQASLTSLRYWNGAVTVVALIIAFFMAAFGARVFVRPVAEMVRTAGKVAAGDLTQRVVVTGDDELGDLGRGFNTMTADLETTVGRVVRSKSKLASVVETVGSRSRTVIDRVGEQRNVIDEAYQSVDQLNAGVRKITENVEALSAASEQTSSSMLQMVASMEEVSRHTGTLFQSVEETASATHQMVSSIAEVDQNVGHLENFVAETSSSMVQMSASIAQVESNAARSYQLTLAVADAAQSGMTAVRETIDGMEQIRQSVVEANDVVSRLGERSAAIGRILNVIEDVAEQTNLLALNAAILAASAGEHGRGFSVVAGEIRDLSERTATSTKEIAALIAAVRDEAANAMAAMANGSRLVEDGVSRSHQAGRELTNILDSATKSSAMGREIAAATREQAAGSENVAMSISRVQEMVKQINSATSQQSTGSEHILRAVEAIREVTRYVRQAMDEQKAGSAMISQAADQMIDRIHDIFQVATGQATQSEKIVRTMEQVRDIAEANRRSAAEMHDAVALLSDAIRDFDEDVRRFRVR